MSEHPIEGLMTTAMNSIQDMIDVNTIIGEPIETSNNIVIIPISKVSFGFAAGGSEFKGETIENVRLIPVNHSSSLDRLIDYMPDLIEKTNQMMNKCIQNKKDATEKIISEISKKNKKSSNTKKEGNSDSKMKKDYDTPSEITYEFEYDETPNAQNNDEESDM